MLGDEITEVQNEDADVEVPPWATDLMKNPLAPQTPMSGDDRDVASRASSRKSGRKAISRKSSSRGDGRRGSSREILALTDQFEKEK